MNCRKKEKPSKCPIKACQSKKKKKCVNKGKAGLKFAKYK